MVDISERSLETTMEQALLANGPDTGSSGASLVREERPDYGEPWPAEPGGYRKRLPSEYDRALCLV